MRALVGTRKGLLVFKRRNGEFGKPRLHFDGVAASYVDYDPVNDCVWAGVNHGHWGPKLHVSDDKGKTFREIPAPKFPDGHGDTLKDFWCIRSDSTGRVWIGTEPGGLFYSDNRGETWSICLGLDTVRGKDKWFGAGTDAHCLHSILVDPDDFDHLLVGISVAGMLESSDRGHTWRYINKGLSAEYLPDKESEVGHDPHLTVMSASEPSVLWQQNHCGLFKSDDMGRNWHDLSKADGLMSAFGWAVAVDEEDADVAYTVPAESDINRTPHDKRLFVQKTTDGGDSWQTLTKGLPEGDCYDIVYRNALGLRGKTLAFGSTTGHLYWSTNRGKNWSQLPTHLPPVYSVRLF